jgi:hypothetical protein
MCIRDRNNTIDEEKTEKTELDFIKFDVSLNTNLGGNTYIENSKLPNDFNNTLDNINSCINSSLNNNDIFVLDHLNGNLDTCDFNEETSLFNTDESFSSHFNSYLDEDTVVCGNNLTIDLLSNNYFTYLSDKKIKDINVNYISYDSSEDSDNRNSLFLDSNNISSYRKIKSIFKKKKKLKEIKDVSTSKIQKNNSSLEDSNASSD